MTIDKVQTFEPGTLIPRGKYIRMCDTGKYNRQYFARKADEERELRLQLDIPELWVAHYFRKERERNEIVSTLTHLILAIQKAGYDVSTLDDAINDL